MRLWNDAFSTTTLLVQTTVFEAFSPITLKRMTAMPRENTTSFIRTCANDVRDVSVFKKFRFRCPHFKCFHPGQRSNACVFDKKRLATMIYGAEIKRWCSNYFYTYMPTVHGNKDWFIKLSKLTLLARTARKPKGGKNTRPYVGLIPCIVGFSSLGNWKRPESVLLWQPTESLFCGIYFQS